MLLTTASPALICRTLARVTVAARRLATPSSVNSAIKQIADSCERSTKVRSRLPR